ncbi:MAG: hypothetical protein ABJK25_06875 [Halieaceae bacterium]
MNFSSSAFSSQDACAKTRALAFVEASLVFLLSCLAFFICFDIESLPLGADGYFHFVMASKLSLGNLAQSVEALPFTLLGKEGPDHHWLTHWMQKPFTLISEENGISYAAVLWAAVVPAILSALMRLEGVAYAGVFAIVGVWGLYLLPDRLLMFRAQNSAIIMVVVLGLLMASRSYIKLAIFTFFFAHAYQGVILAGVTGIAALIAHRLVNAEYDRQMVVACLGGFLLALLTSPWFPENISYFTVMMLGRLISPIDDVSLMGTEWVPVPFELLFQLGFVGHFCLIASWVIIFFSRRKDYSRDTFTYALVFALTATLFLFLYARHWRMGELYGPLSAVALGFSSSLLVNKARKKYLPALVFFIIVVTFLHQVLKHPEYPSHELKFEGHCQYLNDRAEIGDTVLNLSWSSFPFLYYCSPQLVYAAGLDGLMLAHGDPDVFRVWYLLGNQRLEELDAIAVISLFEKIGVQFIIFAPEDAMSVSWLLRHAPESEVLHADSDGILVQVR